MPALPESQLSDVPAAVRASILEDLPEIAGIEDADLREKVIRAWALFLRDSSFGRITDIPGEGAPNHFVLKAGTQELHLRGVARLAVSIVDEFRRTMEDKKARAGEAMRGGEDAGDGSRGGQIHSYRGAEIRCGPDGHCALFMEGHPLHGHTFGAAGTVAGLIDWWMQEDLAERMPAMPEPGAALGTCVGTSGTAAAASRA